MWVFRIIALNLASIFFVGELRAESIGQLNIAPPNSCGGLFNSSNVYGEKADRKGCTFLKRSKWLNDDNFQDLDRLQEVRHESIEWLTYHHQGFRDDEYKKMICRDGGQKNGCVGKSNIRALLSQHFRDLGIVKILWGMHSHQTNTDEDSETAWGEIAYHYIVDDYGNIAEGRPLQYAPHSGTKGDDSALDSFGRHYYPNHLAVVLTGNYDYQKLEDPALLGVARVLSAALLKHRLSADRIGSHRSRGSTSTCPGDNIRSNEHNAIVEKTLALAIQTELQDRGCRPGGVDGVFGPNSKDALARLNKVKNVFGSAQGLRSTWDAMLSDNTICQ